MASVDSEEVACSFCLEYGRFLTRPRSLPCGHHYCEPCLETDFETNKVVRCVKCSTVYDIDLNSLPMADLTGSKTPVWCEICLKKGDTNKAQTYCTVCTKCFCDKHKESHDDLHDDHKKISIEEYQLQSRKLQTRKCIKHFNQVYVSGCRSCLGVFCLKCMTENSSCASKEGASHNMHMLDELAEIVESEFDSMKDNAIAMDKVLSALSKKCSIILDEQKSETKRMVQLLHKSRDAQINSIKTKYENLECHLVKKRESSLRNIEEFLTDKVDALLSDVRRELKLMEARLKDNHQVDIVAGYKGLRDLMQTLIEEQPLRLKVDDMVVLEKNGTFRNIELKMNPKSLKIEAEMLKKAKKPSIAGDLPDIMTMIKMYRTGYESSAVCGSADHVLVAQTQGQLMRIKAHPQFDVTFHEVVTGGKYFIGTGIWNSHHLIVEKGHPEHTVHVKDLKSGELVMSWKHRDKSHQMACILAVVGQQVVMVDRTKGHERLSVYSVNGDVKMHLSCPHISQHWVCICSGVGNTVILSDYTSSKVHCIGIDSGLPLWTSSDVKKPLGVTCYKDKYVLVTNLNKGMFIHVLDINTGKLLNTIFDTTNVFQDNRVFSLYTYENNLVVPRYGDKTVVFYRLE